jgi:hypothetical protein
MERIWSSIPPSAIELGRGNIRTRSIGIRRQSVGSAAVAVTLIHILVTRRAIFSSNVPTGTRSLMMKTCVPLGRVICVRKIPKRAVTVHFVSLATPDAVGRGCKVAGGIFTLCRIHRSVNEALKLI